MKLVGGQGVGSLFLYKKIMGMCLETFFIIKISDKTWFNYLIYSLPIDLYGEVEILDDGKIKVSQGVQVPSEDDDVLIKSTRDEVNYM